MKNISKKAVGVVLIGLMLTPAFFVSAKTNDNGNGQERAKNNSAEIELKIANLTKQLEMLQAQLKEKQNNTVSTTVNATPTPMAVVGVYTFGRPLYYGLKGDDVAKLQEFLKQFPDVYTGDVTGYFGPLTQKALKKYQKKFGIDQTGYFGPKTREHVNKYRHGNDDKVTVCHSGNTLTVAEEALKAHLAHGDVRGVCGTTTSDITAPVISGILATPTSNSAVVTWTTDEGATSVVKYGTTTPIVSSSTTSVVENNALVTAHSMTLSSLIPSTVYHYIVVSRDVAGNMTTSTEGTFTTLATPDTTAPIISLASSVVSSSTVAISWTTNEPATSVVKYATTTPVMSASNILTVENLTLTTAHSLTLPALSATTTYYYIPVSKDAVGNTATGTEGTFNTL